MEKVLEFCHTHTLGIFFSATVLPITMECLRKLNEQAEVEMDEKVDWKVIACEKQLKFFEVFGSRQYDEIKKSNLFALKKKVGYATCGRPNELPTPANYYTGYSPTNLDNINKICHQIVTKSDYDPIQFESVVLILFRNGEISETSVFKIGTKIGGFFIDSNSKVYKDWDDFMINNKLPVCEYCYPLNGDYHDKEKHVSFALSPACTLTRSHSSTIGSVSSMVPSLCLTLEPLPLLSILAPLSGPLSITTYYSVSERLETRYDRNKHTQYFGSEESSIAWNSVLMLQQHTGWSSAIHPFSTVWSLILAATKMLVLPLPLQYVYFKSFGFIKSLFQNNEESPSITKYVFDLSSELLYLFNDPRAIFVLIELINSTYKEEHLTKTQKRNLRRAAKSCPKCGQSPPAEPENGRHVKIILDKFMEFLRFYNPRTAEIFFKFYSIGHDLMCWRSKDISTIEFLTRVCDHSFSLYAELKDEISEIMKYFQNVKIDNNFPIIQRMFTTAPKNVQTDFCTKIINVEDLFEKMISETELELMDFHKRLGLNVNLEPSENTAQDDPNDDDELNQETQMLLSCCDNLIKSICCNDMENFCKIFDCVKSILMSEYKEKVSNYKKSVEAAKSFSGSSFDIAAFHATLNIRHGDVSQHIVNDILQGISVASVVDKMKRECEQMEKKINYRFSPVWEVGTGGIFHYNGSLGAGYLDKKIISDMISDIIKQPQVNWKWEKDDKGTFMIDTNCKPNTHIIVVQEVSEENTASGTIVVLPNQENNV